MHGRTHHFRDVHGAGDAAVRIEVGVLRTDAERDILRFDLVRKQALLLLLVEHDLLIRKLHDVLAVFEEQLRVEEVHDGHADEARDEQVCRMVEHILRRADLLHIAVSHDDDTIAERHCFGLVMRNIDERRVNALSELDDLRAHFVSELCIEV